MDDDDLDFSGLVGPDLGWGMGARRRTRGGQRRARRALPSGGRSGAAMARQQRVEMQADRVIPDAPGIPARDAAYLPIAWPTFIFNATSGVILRATINPRTFFRGRRLVAAEARAGATATGIVRVVDLQVGMRPINVTANPVPIAAFFQNAFDTDLLIPPAEPGVDMTLTLDITAAPTMTDTVTVTVGMIGGSLL